MFKSIIQQTRNQSTLFSPRTNARLNAVFPSLSSVSTKDLFTKPFTKSQYHISRTSKGNLPVYRRLKSQAYVTEVKRVQGDLVLFRNELQELMPEVSKNKFECVLQSKTLRIKGDHAERVRELLSEKF
ncbi:unnamed protein product [Ambrosiozyma monospora]|uniref:Large ribosomal subunit protein mL49 n=1 Tax=Ambrosiozyma monospora TaxID=43982 RepID=A0A9W7DHU1_AMBMO|nr:unnamed protein product [Ambrosiozyma monospora]